MASKPKNKRAETPAADFDGPWSLGKGPASVVFWCAAILTAVFLHFSSENVPDPDVLYHFRHAEIYGRAGVAGLFSGDFPWLPYLVIGAYGADLWYSFHLLVIPFTWIEDPMLGLRLAGIFTTALFLFLIY